MHVDVPINIIKEVRKPKKKSRSRLKWGTVFAIAIAIPAFYAFANARVLQAGEGKTFEDVEAIPHHRVGIVLGCSPMIGQYKNSFFTGRIAAAASLYKAGKVDRLLVTGDNGRQGYDEPTAMEEALIVRGVPKEHITKDFAGFRTLDSMVRAKKVFGVNDATIITDDFHLARSIYFAESVGINSDGFPSKAGLNAATTRTEVREVLARGLAVIDQEVLHSQPKFLGKQETIP